MKNFSSLAVRTVLTDCTKQQDFHNTDGVSFNL